MLPYIDYWVRKGVKLNSISRHMLQLFAGQSGTKAWKRYISEHAYLPGADAMTIDAALAKVNPNLCHETVGKNQRVL